MGAGRVSDGHRREGQESGDGPVAAVDDGQDAAEGHRFAVGEEDGEPGDTSRLCRAVATMRSVSNCCGAAKSLRTPTPADPVGRPPAALRRGSARPRPCSGPRPRSPADRRSRRRAVPCPWIPLGDGQRREAVGVGVEDHEHLGRASMSHRHSLRGRDSRRRRRGTETPVRSTSAPLVARIPGSLQGLHGADGATALAAARPLDPGAPQDQQGAGDGQPAQRGRLDRPLKTWARAAKARAREPDEQAAQVQPCPDDTAITEAQTTTLSG